MAVASSSVRPSRRLSAGLRVALAALLATAGLVAVSASASAETATGGSGRYVGAIEWMTWGADGTGIPNTGATETRSFSLGDQVVDLTCTIGTVTGSSAGSHLNAYRPADWSGDGLDDLYNIGGSGSANTLVNGLATNNSDTVTFPFDCSASSGGSPFPLEGLVIADAEQLNGTGEYISAEVSPQATSDGAMWRLIDRFRAPACTASTIGTVDAANTLTISNDANCGASGGPSTVLFLDGASSSPLVTMNGGGISALALGVMISTDHGDAPASYGDAGHLVQTTWTGGDLPAGTASTSLFDPALSLGTPSAPAVRLGLATDSEIHAAVSSLATGDDSSDTSGAGISTDEDSLGTLSRIYVLPGDTYSVTPTCAGGSVAGWVDWNHDGDFADAGERSNTATCTDGEASLSWTVPNGTVTAVSTPTFLRLRTALDATEIQLAISKANAGEAEDYALEVEIPTPTANADTASTGQNTRVTLDPAGNDTTSPQRPATTVIDATSVRLIDPATSTAVTTLTVSGGRFSVDTATGQVTFAPSAGFSGTADAVTYRVADSEGQVAESTLTVTVTAVTPSATADAASTDQGATVGVAVLDNDAPGNAATPLDPTTVVLLGSSGATVSDAGKTLTVDGEGVYRIAADGTVSFTPVPAFTGTATAVGYRVADADGGTADGALTVTVNPLAPRLTADTATTEQNTAVTLSPIGNDQPGVDGGTAIDPVAVRLVDTDGTAVTTLVTTGGTFTVNTTTGAVTFTPAQGVVGTVAAPYQVADENGQVSASTITVTVTAVAPVAVADTGSTDQGSAATIPVLDNDRAGNAATPLDDTSVVLLPSTDAAVSDAGATLTVAGEGVYRVAADGSVTFTPAPAFTGTATSVSYRVADIDGGTDTATITISVRPVAPRVSADTATTEQNTPVTVSPAGNDQPGVDGGTAVDPATVRLVDGDGSPVTTLVTAGGTFTVNATTGAVTFTPAQGFVGTAAVPYRVADENGKVSASTVTVTVTPVTPVAADDVAATDQGSAVAVPVLDNDRPGNAATPLDPATVVLLPEAGGALADAGKALTIPDEGTYRVDADGVITLTPEPGFSGTATTVHYRVTDADGTATQAGLAVTVAPVAPRTVPDTATGAPGMPVTTDVIGNDRPGVDGGNALVPGSLRLAASAVDGAVLSADRRTLTIPGEGQYVVAADGTITFTPAAGFTGQATTVAYEISDTAGLTVQGALTVTIGADVVPAAADEGPFDSVVTFDPVADSGLYFIDGTGARVDSLAVPEGVYEITDDGQVRFTPNDGFQGDATAVTLYGFDSDGNAVAQSLRASVLPPAPVPAPAATAPPAIQDDASQLAHTGSTAAPFLAVALLMLTLGAAALIGGRRRKLEE